MSQGLEWVPGIRFLKLPRRVFQEPTQPGSGDWGSHDSYHRRESHLLILLKEEQAPGVRDPRLSLSGAQFQQGHPGRKSKAAFTHRGLHVLEPASTLPLPRGARSGPADPRPWETVARCSEASQPVAKVLEQAAGCRSVRRAHAAETGMRRRWRRAGLQPGKPPCQHTLFPGL